jgi:cytosine/adenosine deaminase-related metal-dependent hydrolase
MILRARVVLPVSGPPIEDGAVAIARSRITRVGRWSEFSRPRRNKVVDLGDAVLLPGLVNAHCHLDYTDMAGQFPPQKAFTDWIKLITTAKSEWSYSEFAASWLHGARMLVQTGTTTVGDIEVVPELLAEAWPATPLRVISFMEMTGVRSRRNPRVILRETLDHIRSLPRRGRSRAALSPHAPYSTSPELMRRSAAVSLRRHWPLCTHVAESAQEFEMFLHARGDMFDWLRRNGRNMDDCGLGSPVQHLERSGALNQNLIAVHANYLTDADAARLGRRKVSVVHCPRSHAYFQHGKFPFRELARARVNLCLATDSLATVYRKPREPVELSLFDEMRAFTKTHPRLSPKTIVEMVTVNGARALGLAGKVGQLSPGAFADLITIPFAGRAADACDAVTHFSGHVTASMINGEWAAARQG